MANLGEIFLHVGMQYGSPFRPTFALMKREDPAASDEDVAPQHLLLRATGEFAVAFSIAEGMNQKDSWSVQLYEVEDSLRPVATMTPGLVSVIKIDVGEISLWPRAPGRRPPRRRPARAGGVGSSDSDDDAVDDDGDMAIEDIGADAEPPADDGAYPDDELSDELEDDVDGERERVAAELVVDGLLAEVCAAADPAAAVGEHEGEAAPAAPEVDPEAPAGSKQ